MRLYSTLAITVLIIGCQKGSGGGSNPPPTDPPVVNPPIELTDSQKKLAQLEGTWGASALGGKCHIFYKYDPQEKNPETGTFSTKLLCAGKEEGKAHLEESSGNYSVDILGNGQFDIEFTRTESSCDNLNFSTTSLPADLRIFANEIKISQDFFVKVPLSDLMARMNNFEVLTGCFANGDTEIFVKGS